MEESLSSARNEEDRRANDFKSLEITVNEMGYKVLKNVPYDGNCFFNAVAEFTNESGIELRKRVAEFVEREVRCMNNYFRCVNHVYSNLKNKEISPKSRNLKNFIFILFLFFSRKDIILMIHCITELLSSN